MTVLIPIESNAELGAANLASPCSSPCDSPCGQPCDDPCGEDGPCRGGHSLGGKVIKAGFYNAMEICLDELSEEPRTMMLVGGSRQLEFAKYLSFLLPFTEIFIVDPDADEIERARTQICCRFKFIQTSLEKLPFEDDYIDITIGHNLFEFVGDWEQAMAEIGRVTTKRFVFSTFRPRLWKLFGGLPGMKETLIEMGTPIPVHQPENNDIFRHISRYGKIKVQLEPFPYKMYTAHMKPVREERLSLRQN